MKLAPSEVSRDSVQVVLRESTSISPDCSAVKRSLADSGTNLTLVGSLKIAAAIARQISTSSPVQLPLSSGDEKPGRPWLTPQDSMPRSLTVLRVCAVAACGRKTGGESKGENQGYAFHGQGLSRVVRNVCIVIAARDEADPMIRHPQNASPRPGSSTAQSGQAMDRRSRQAPQRAATE